MALYTHVFYFYSLCIDLPMVAHYYELSNNFSLCDCSMSTCMFYYLAILLIGFIAPVLVYPLISCYRVVLLMPLGYVQTVAKICAFHTEF